MAASVRARANQRPFARRKRRFEGQHLVDLAQTSVAISRSTSGSGQTELRPRPKLPRWLRGGVATGGAMDFANRFRRSMRSGVFFAILGEAQRSRLCFWITHHA